MSQAARNDEQAKRMIEFMFREGMTVDNLVRMLNYHFAETFTFTKDNHEKATIRRVPDGSNYAPSVEIWRQP